MPRQAARRLAKGRVCRAPEALRGHSITLVDGGVLDIAPDGRCVLAGVGARPGRGPRVEALSLHLVEPDFFRRPCSSIRSLVRRGQLAC